MGKDSLQHQFMNSRAKIQFFGGGFANGKTAALCVKALRLCQDYPGSNGVICRETRPKLADTIQKEFFKWLPNEWIKSYNKTDAVLILTNGTTVNFRYLRQEGKTSGESTTSNLLSATFDWILVDQIEDPGIVYKDFTDLLGRLRGSTTYKPTGDYDISMPKSGPRWLILASNPTANWVYQKLIKPLQEYKAGRMHPDLLVDKKTGLPLVELFEGSTYTNKDNLAEDFIDMLEASYTGQMRDRYLLGKWASYEGLIYPSFDQDIHMIPPTTMLHEFNKINTNSNRLTIIEAYDHGIASPSCYLFGYVDHLGNIGILDGFYEKELLISNIDPDNLGIVERIKKIRNKYLSNKQIENCKLYIDPALFRRGSDSSTDSTISSIMHRHGIVGIRRANNNIQRGINKVNQYLSLVNHHINPFTKHIGGCYMYFNAELTFILDEITSYRWKKDTQGDNKDLPIDKNDHAMDALKYIVTGSPEISGLVPMQFKQQPEYLKWHEYSENQYG